MNENNTKKKTVKGLSIGSKVIAVTFDINQIPPDGGFHGWMIDHTVTDIIGDTTVVLQMTNKPDKQIKFDFRDDTINCLYSSPEPNGWYTGLFTDLKLFFEQYKNLQEQLKLNTEKKEDSNV